jgi:uncharacterized Tic20 family protein
MIGESVETTSEERVLAAVAHFFGIIASLLVFATQKDRSRFVRFQALQALAFEGVFMVAYMLFMFCLMGAVLVFIFGGAIYIAQSPSNDPVVPGMAIGMVAPWLMFMCIMPVVFVALIVRLIAAMSVATGHNFRYPLIGSRVEAFLSEPGAAAPAAPA